MICLEDKKIHFIGVGGVGVNALARFAAEHGAVVSGSDAKFNSLCKILKDSGADIREGVHPEIVDSVDEVVYSSAIKSDHPELVRARERGIPVFERQQFLADIASGFQTVVGIAGTHGKTTTTSMLAHILASVNKSFVAMIGGESVDFGNYVNNSKGLNEIFAVEACEYKRNFLTLKPTVALVTNVECDHPDCYRDLQSVRDAFDEYLEGAPNKIYQNGERSADRWEIVSQSEKYRLTYDVENKGDICRFYFDGIFAGNIDLKEGGDYNLINASFAVVAAHTLGVNIKDSLSALKTFKGVKRRFERAADINGVPAYFDFAHHPTEIKCVLKRAAKMGKILAVFQPHTYSRTKAYFDDFAEVLGTDANIGTLVIMPTYAAREYESDGCGSDALAREIIKRFGKKDTYTPSDAQSAIEFVKKAAKSHSVVMFIGAGDIYDLRDRI